jgi:hypothetical protein
MQGTMQVSRVAAELEYGPGSNLDFGEAQIAPDVEQHLAAESNALEADLLVPKGIRVEMNGGWLTISVG